MDAVIRKKIQETYPESVTADKAVLTECVSVCSTFNLDPSDLRYKLEAMNYKATNTRTEILPITLDTLKTFRVQLKRDLARESMKKAQAKARPTATTARVDRSKLPNQLMNQGRAMDVDGPGPSGAASSSVEVKKESSGITFSTGHTHVVFEGVGMDSESRNKRSYRYMYEKTTERSEVLDQLIDDFAELIKDHYDIPELADPSSTTDEEVTIVGRVAQDPDVAPGSKLTDKTLVIESSRMLSSGARIPLRLEQAIKVRGAVQGSRGYSLFPGQIVALQGKNGGGGYFLATTILAIPPLKPSPTSEGLINPKADPGLGDKPASVCIASGPYSSDQDLLYKPWRQFLDIVTSNKPHVLILLGPYVDALHPKIKNGESETSPQSIFQARFINPIKKFLTVSPRSIVIFIPSVRDVTSNHCAFPQPEFDRTFDGIAGDPRIIFQPNPSRFKINDISFAATSVDVFLHLRKEELFKVGSQHEASIPAQEGDDGHDPVSNLCRHLLDQRSFYPLFPPPQELSHEVNLDVSHLDEARMIDDGEIDYAPDVLITPSRLKRFDKVVNTTLVINPSLVSKGAYVFLNIGSKSASSNLRERLKVDFVKELVQATPVKPEAAS